MIYEITIIFEDKDNQHEIIVGKIGKLLENCGVEHDIITGKPYQERVVSKNV